VPDLHVHVQKYSEFGIAFPKALLVTQGACPVFYIAQNSHFRSGHSDVRLSELYERMLDQLFERLDPINDRSDLPNLVLQRFVAYIKLFDSSLPEGDPDNYYMEREWRVLGKVEFEVGDVARIVIPSDFAQQFRDKVPEYCGQISFPDAS
jgi:Putative abortive phage resistance protein AbiGi, antitoxin